MAFTHYPSGANLAAYLAEAGITVNSGTLEARARAGRSLVERKCGRRFLAEEVATVHAYAPPEGSSVLRLPDFAEVTAMAFQATGGTATPWTLDTDYTLERENDGVALGGVTPPYTGLVLLPGSFRTPLSNYYRAAIRVTGRQGYADAIPEDVWLAMQAVGAGLALGVLSVSAGSGVVRWRRGDVEKQYGAGGRYGEIAQDAVSLLDAVVAVYRRHSL